TTRTSRKPLHDSKIHSTGHNGKLIRMIILIPQKYKTFLANNAFKGREITSIRMIINDNYFN
ncbi:MAG: hypothetical protein VX577_05680, partial [Verrucomicrobiota bacterium]|nr:hypothetical protein [Verrucomicrobiota bacterium]